MPGSTASLTARVPGCSLTPEFTTQSCLDICLEHAATALRLADGDPHAPRDALVALVRCLFAQAREGLRKASVPGVDSDAASRQRSEGMYIAHVALSHALTHLHVRPQPLPVRFPRPCALPLRAQSRFSLGLSLSQGGRGMTWG
jgi:hypothetical protein